MTQTEIGAWLKARREDAGLTQMQAAARIGRQSGLLSKWERGELRMTAESFLELVRLYQAEGKLLELFGKRRVYHTPRTSGTTSVGKGGSDNSRKR